ncbi:hypothetical protein CH289_16055 [Rhodococcus sp. RS1C4]|nr:hypothetical protein [Rhodococcus sp. RS1C4]OZC50538.1 hypothetical protein CH289_16055 [Rhodococcus sp. RS1C4]
MSIQYGPLNLARLVCDGCGIGRVFGVDSSNPDAEEAKATLRGWTHDSAQIPRRNWCSECTAKEGDQ